jgi:uncharacterized protein YjbJ (UPF0337 family)
MLLLILTIVLILALAGSVPAWPHSRGWGYYPSGFIGLVLLALLGLFFAGRLWFWPATRDDAERFAYWNMDAWDWRDSRTHYLPFHARIRNAKYSFWWICLSLRMSYVVARRQSNLAKEPSMKQSSKDEAKGTFHEAKGTLKQSIGRATNNPDLEADGQDEKITGKVQKKVGQVGKVLDE